MQYFPKQRYGDNDGVMTMLSSSYAPTYVLAAAAEVAAAEAEAEAAAALAAAQERAEAEAKAGSSAPPLTHPIIRDCLII